MRRQSAFLLSVIATAILAACGGGGGGGGFPIATTPPASGVPIAPPETTSPPPAPPPGTDVPAPVDPVDPGQPPVEPPATPPVVTLPYEGIYVHSTSTTSANGGVTLIKPDGSFWGTSLWTDDAVWSTKVSADGVNLKATSLPLGKATGRYLIVGTYDQFKSINFDLGRPSLEDVNVPILPDPTLVGSHFGGRGFSTYQPDWNTNLTITAKKYDGVRQLNAGSSLTFRADGTFSGIDFQPASQTPTVGCKFEGVTKDTGLSYKEVTFIWGADCYTREGTVISPGIPMVAVLIPMSYLLNGQTYPGWTMIAKNEGSANRFGFSRLFNR